MNFELKNVFQWLTSNKLTLNQKNQILLSSARIRNVFPLSRRFVSVLDHQTNILTYLECKECVKYLRVLIDYELSWKNHIDSMALKISKTIGLLSILRYFVPHHTLVNI